MIKILMLNNEFPPLGGGTGTVNQEILKQHVGNSYLEIDLVTSSADKNQSIETFDERITIYKIPVNRFNIHHASNKELILYGWRAFWQAYNLHKKSSMICVSPGVLFRLVYLQWFSSRSAACHILFE